MREPHAPRSASDSRALFGAAAARVWRRRSASTSAETSRSSLRFGRSIRIGSPSFTSAIGPPRAASGVTYPIAGPCVAPENRPSVTRAQLFPRPAPISADVAPSISRMPGPPRVPSFRMTMQVPGSMALLRTASIAPSSASKTRAVENGLPHVFDDTGCLDDCAAGREAALEDVDGAFRRHRIAPGVNTVVVRYPGVLDQLPGRPGHRPSRSPDG